MVLVVFGIDALDFDLVNRSNHPNLTLESHKRIETIASKSGEPSTHELWPTIITGLKPESHGLVLDDGVAWENPILRYGSRVADYVLPAGIQRAIGAWLLTNTDQDAFRVPASYYEQANLQTVFDGRTATAIGIPNYVTDPDTEDREHTLRRQMGELFQRDPNAKGGHTSSDPTMFYEQCMEMAMIRVARTRRGLRSRQYELVFGYTSGLDLTGHIAYQQPGIQDAAYTELDEFVGDLRADLSEQDELLLISDHGLQDGLHTDSAMVAATTDSLCSQICSVTDVRASIETELRDGDHSPDPRSFGPSGATDEAGETVREHLDDLGYL